MGKPRPTASKLVGQHEHQQHKLRWNSNFASVIWQTTKTLEGIPLRTWWN